MVLSLISNWDNQLMSEPEKFMDNKMSKQMTNGQSSSISKECKM